MGEQWVGAGGVDESVRTKQPQINASYELLLAILPIKQHFYIGDVTDTFYHYDCSHNTPKVQRS